MSQHADYFKQAELALAAYGNFTTNIPRESELTDAGFSITQARDSFMPEYRVIDQHSDGTGVSATVFKSIGENPQTFLAIRGTDSFLDVVTDAIDITLIGSTTQQLQYISLKAKVTEWLNSSILPESFTVTGHSLGGFLVTDLAADLAFANNISHTYLYNTPKQGGIFNDGLSIGPSQFACFVPDKRISAV